MLQPRRATSPTGRPHGRDPRQRLHPRRHGGEGWTTAAVPGCSRSAVLALAELAIARRPRHVRHPVRRLSDHNEVALGRARPVDAGRRRRAGDVGAVPGSAARHLNMGARTGRGHPGRGRPMTSACRSWARSSRTTRNPTSSASPRPGRCAALAMRRWISSPPSPSDRRTPATWATPHATPCGSSQAPTSP